MENEVKEILFKVKDSHTFVTSDVVTHTDSVASYILTDGVLRASLYNSVASNKLAIEKVFPTVLSWEFEPTLIYGFKQISFELKTGNVESERRPIDISSEDDELVILNRYPSPPSITATEAMVNIWERYSMASVGIREPVTSAAYFALTSIVGIFGSQKETARVLNIQLRVLRKLGELTSTRGDIHTARKGNAVSSDLTQLEKRWINQVIRHMLLNLGCRNANAECDEITMETLPNLAVENA